MGAVAAGRQSGGEREGGIQPAAGGGGGGKWRTWWRVGLSCGGVTSAFTHWRGRTSIEKRQQSVVAAECALVRFVDGQRWWSWWLQDVAFSIRIVCPGQ